MRLVVGAGGEIGLVGRDQRQAEAVCEVDQRRLDNHLGFEPVALQFDIEPIAESRWPTARCAPRRGRPCDGSSGRSIAPLGPPVSAIRPSAPIRASNGMCASSPSFGSSQREETSRISVSVAGLGLGEEHDRRAGDAELGEARGGGGRIAEIDRDLRADDRLHADLGELFRKLQRAEQVVGVGDRQRRHGVGLGELCERLDRERALAQREGAVEVKVHETDGFENRRIPCRIVASAGPGVEGRSLWMSGTAPPPLQGWSSASRAAVRTSHTFMRANKLKGLGPPLRLRVREGASPARKVGHASVEGRQSLPKRSVRAQCRRSRGEYATDAAAPNAGVPSTGASGFGWMGRSGPAGRLRWTSGSFSF